MKAATFKRPVIGRLSIKLFLSYLIVIGLGTLTLLMAVNQVAIDSFTGRMRQYRGGTTIPGQGRGTAQRGLGALDPAVADAFQGAINDALLVAGIVAVVVAVIISLVVTGRITGPVRRMSEASRRIAAGKYSERVVTKSKDELGELAYNFNQMAETLEETEHRRMELIGDVAHELRTPVATLEGYLEGLLDGVIESNERTWAKLHDEAGRLRRLVDDLQELSRAEARQVPLNIASVNPLEIAQVAIERLSHQYAEKGLEFSTELPQNLPTIKADHDRTVQVVTNLLTNALRYTPAPGKVQLTLSHKGNEVEYRVTDNGVGIAPENLPHLFERFYRVDKSRSRALGGSGIGLTIAKALVEEMGGTIQVKSGGAGKGATFSFTLPIAR
ncbi:MAG: HAMP domain-containing protein [Chloroflexi bacterium]|uniref:histidine kinase n=1 Tax=Candidatus Chlorohelix allophototropha TaxID=3003348 RepID=A0A8T7M4K2_9CHLR|nr:HAMP domain-containing protein [Chloroflexota bacterium]WJW70009.1 ATP-binding protein [Chloroflexota bacterium L227-S17]